MKLYEVIISNCDKQDEPFDCGNEIITLYHIKMNEQLRIELAECLFNGRTQYEYNVIGNDGLFEHRLRFDENFVLEWDHEGEPNLMSLEKEGLPLVKSLLQSLQLKEILDKDLVNKPYVKLVKI